MKTIVISGARSGTGESTLARAVCELIEGAVRVTIGHPGAETESQNIFYQSGTAWSRIEAENRNRPFLIIESDDLPGGMAPDCSIRLDGDSTEPLAAGVRGKADFISGHPIDAGTIERCANRLSFPPPMARRIAWLSGCRPEPVTALVLTGGKSSRIRSDKAFLKVGGERLIDRIARQIRQSVDAVIVVTSAEKADQFPGYIVAVDEMPDQGPLRGIISGLARSQTQVNFVVACDIPDVNVETIRGLLSWSEDFDVVVPSLAEGEKEPLFAMYRKSLLPAGRRLLDKGERRVVSLYPLCRTKTVFLPRAAWLANLNTRDDYEKYIRKQKGK